MKIFQTKSGKKKNIWHIYCGQDTMIWNHTETQTKTAVTQVAICNSGTNWVGGYHSHDDFEKFPKAPVVEFDSKAHARLICPACVERAYRDGWIDVIPNATYPNPYETVSDSRK